MGEIIYQMVASSLLEMRWPDVPMLQKTSDARTQKPETIPHTGTGVFSTWMQNDERKKRDC